MISKTLLAGMGALALSTGSASADIIISEIVDGPLAGGLPKFVELTNTGGIAVDLSTICIGNFNNGGTDLGGGSALQLGTMLAPGASYVLSYEAGDSPGVGTFFTVYGIDPSNFDLSAFINGDDVVAIFMTDGTGPNGEATGDGTDATMLDVYGELGVNGDGEVWDYTDSGAQRCNDDANGGVWDPSIWQYLGTNGLEDPGGDPAETILLQTLTFPFSHPDCGGMGGEVTAFCFGDGTGAACPCGNDSPNAGEGCANSTTTGCTTTSTGSTSIGAADFGLVASNALPSQPGIFFQGDTNVGGGMGIPFGDGLRCAGTNVVRLEVAVPDASGTATSAINIATKGGVSDGDTRFYQYWYRDPSGGPCGASFNLSNGLEVDWQA